MTHASIRLLAVDPFPADPALGSLIALARRHHRLVDEEILKAGLAVDPCGRLAREDLPRAAARAGFSAHPVCCELAAIRETMLPALLLLADGDACILTAKRNPGSWELLLPDAGGLFLIPTGALATRYAGELITLRPHEATTDDEVEPLPPPPLPRLPWRMLAPIALAPLPADILALALAFGMPRFTDHWGSDMRTVAGIAALAMAVEGVIRVCRGYLVQRAGRATDGAFAERLFQQVLGQAPTPSPATFASALSSYAAERMRLSRSAVAALAELPLMIAISAALIWLSKPLALLPVAALPLFLGIGLLLGTTGPRAFDRWARHAAKRQGLLAETLAEAETIRALGAERHLTTSWAGRSAAATAAAASLRSLELASHHLPRLLQVVVLIGLAAWGAALVTSAALSASAYAASLLLAGRLLAYLVETTRLLACRRTVTAALGSLRGLADLPTGRERSEPHLMPRELRDGIVIEHVALRHGEATDPVLEGVNLRIRPGDRVAFTGPAGSGKTTMARLILGLQPPAFGRITVDGGKPAVNEAETRPLFGYVPQDAMLISGTVRENIRLCRPAAGEDAIRQVAELVGIEELIAGNGLDAPVGERGCLLSIGQRQGICLARALLADAPVVLLDDPCSSWSDDALTALAARLQPMLFGRTLIVISQRGPLLSLAHRVLWVEGGKVREAVK